MHQENKTDKDIKTNNCPVCARFPAPTTKFAEIGISTERHGTLFQCTACGAFIEIVAEERTHKILSKAEVDRFYSCS